MIEKKSPIPSFLLAGFILGIGESLFYYKIQLFTVPIGELVSFLVFAGIVDSIILGIFAFLLKLIFRQFYLLLPLTGCVRLCIILKVSSE